MISYGSHDVDQDDIHAVADVLKSPWLTTGPIVEKFEEQLSALMGGVEVVAVSSGTAALHTAYAAAGLGRGDEVITPPITFVATQAALVQVGAQPVFADVDPRTALIDPAAVEAAITQRTAAIVCVDFAGHPADLSNLRAIADRHKLLLIEDAAHSLGSFFEKRPVGSIADLTTFSFFPTKNITTGEGGAVSSIHEEIIRRARSFSHQGLTRDPAEFVLKNEGPWHQEVHRLGLNYRLSDIHAALGLSQLARLQYFKRERARIKGIYDSALSQTQGLAVPVQRPHVDPMWHLYPLQVPARFRRSIFEQLRAAGIGVQVNYLPAYRHPALRQFGDPGKFPGSETFYSREISLPLHTRLSTDDVQTICWQISAIISEIEST